MLYYWLLGMTTIRILHKLYHFVHEWPHWAISQSQGLLGDLMSHRHWLHHDRPCPLKKGMHGSLVWESWLLHSQSDHQHLNGHHYVFKPLTSTSDYTLFPTVVVCPFDIARLPILLHDIGVIFPITCKFKCTWSSTICSQNIRKPPI